MSLRQCHVRIDLSRLMMGSGLNKPIVSWKYPKPKMHVIHLTYQQLRQPTLSVLRKLTLAYSQAKPSNVKPIFYISYNLLHTILKKKKKKNGCMDAERSFTLVAAWLTASWRWVPLPSILRDDHTDRIWLSREKIQIQNAKYSFYWIHIPFAPC